MLAEDSTIVPEGVRLLNGDELYNKLMDLTSKGVLFSYEEGNGPEEDTFYGFSKDRYNSKYFYRYDGIEGQMLHTYTGKYLGMCYLGSDNRIYPANNDINMITRLIIEVD